MRTTLTLACLVLLLGLSVAAPAVSAGKATVLAGDSNASIPSPTRAAAAVTAAASRSSAASAAAAGAAAADGSAAGQAFQLDARSISAAVIAFLVASLAASAGVGGGAFFVPLYMLALGFGLKDATVLSQCTIAAVSAASIIFNLPKRHPSDPNSTLIAYELLLTMTPALLLGVSIGVIFNVAFPTWLITTLLITLLAFMSVRTAQKGLQQWRSETAAQQQAAAAAAAAAGEAEPLVGGSSSRSSGGDVSEAAGASGAVVVISDGPGVVPGGEGGGKAVRAPYPWGMAAGVVFLWCGFALLQLLRQHATRCSPAFYGVMAGQAVFGLGCSAFFAYVCLARPAREAEAQDQLSAPLLASSSTNSLSGLLARRQHQQQAHMGHLMAVVAKVLLAGIVAGVVGIGGGMLMAPMLLDAGIHPQSTSATSNILVFMSSSSAALAFLLEGRVPLQYAAVFCGVAGTASLLGLTGVGRLVKASGRPSIVVLLLAFIMGAGGLCSAVFGYMDAWEHGDTGFKSIC